MSLLNNNLNSFGLDLSDRAIKVAQLEKKNEKLVLRGYRREELPTGIIVDGEIKKSEELATYIKSACAHALPRPIRSKFVIYSIPETKGFIRVIHIPNAAREDLESLVFAEIEQCFPISIEESYVDWQVLRTTPGGDTEILAAAVPQALVDSYSEALVTAGLKPVAAEIESIAISRSLINERHADKPTLIIDLGRDRTGFIIYKAPTVQFTASIPVCGEELARYIAKKMGISEEEAYALEEKCGLSRKGKCAQVYEAMDAGLMELTGYIERLLGYYNEHYRNEPDISKVILCGGEACLEGISSMLSYKIKKSVEEGNPWVNIIAATDKEQPPIARNDSLIFVTVLGLALRGVEEDNSI
jgi:type IV pilus assembly protein PilM